MPGQGWAGSQSAAGPDLRCAICLKDGKSIFAETTVLGTALCRHHVSWVSLPVTPPEE